MVSIKEIKSTIAVAIAAAFGFIIALIWKDIIVGLMKLAGMWQEGGPTILEWCNYCNSRGIDYNCRICARNCIYFKVGRRSTKVKTLPSFF